VGGAVIDVYHPRVYGGAAVAPTRDALIGGRISFQGLYVETPSYGRLPLFDPAIGWFPNAADRQACYAAKRAAGDTLVCLALSGSYRSRGQAYQDIPGRDYSQDIPALRALIAEVLAAGFDGVWLMLAGDGESNAARTYNDPVGMTYGYDWLMEQFAGLHAALADLDPWIVYVPGFDGVVPAWQPWNKVNRWLEYARSIVGPSGYLGLEYSAGYASWSGEQDDFATPAGQAMDLALMEFPYPMGPPDTAAPADFCNQSAETRAPWDQVWQTSARWLGPAWRRPADQPACDDPHPPGYNQTTPRGPRAHWAFEFDTYGSVRWLDPATTERRRAYLRSLGWAHVG
jgi:hypothetical protein